MATFVVDYVLYGIPYPVEIEAVSPIEAVAKAKASAPQAIKPVVNAQRPRVSPVPKGH